MQEEIIPYLLNRSRIQSSSFIEDDVHVEDISRRNHNFKVIRSHGPSYLLKQGAGPQDLSTTAYEAQVYQFLHSSASNHLFARYIPMYYGYDPESQILLLELIPGAQTLAEYYTHSGRFSVTLARELGSALSALHQVDRVNTAGPGIGAPFLQDPPWVLSIHRPILEILRDISSANIRLIQIIQQFPEFCDFLDELRQEWKAETLIHRDIKSQNCLVFASPGSQRTTRLKIVDWEIASQGDPGWDVGSVFSDYLNFWVSSIPLTREVSPDEFIKIARYPLERIQPALRSFWKSYTLGMQYEAGEADERLLQAVRYGAARLLQSAYEHMQHSTQLTGNIICILQLSLNLLKQPCEAAGQLLGIPFQNAQNLFPELRLL